uniref:NF-kappa-B inhibitor-like protein 1 n=1 Tax=Salarias fasciatus TaxID=181472 RepID=A0A672F641_SALFA
TVWKLNFLQETRSQSSECKSLTLMVKTDFKVSVRVRFHVLKLKAYLRKHRDLDVNFSQGKRQKSPLHLACGLGDDASVRLLLRHGADVLRRDRRGNTALHVAADRVLKHGKTAFDDLVVPLKRSCPDALNAPNRAGITPQDLLSWTRQSQVNNDHTDISNSNSINICRANYEHICLLLRKTKEEREEEERSNRELQEKLRREHEEYLARAARKEEETRLGNKRRYDERCAATFQAGSSADGVKLSYGDIPWPAPRGSIQEMIDVMLHGVDRKDAAGFRKALRKQQALWHPDKFAQRCEARLEEKDKQRVLDTVTALSQELNKLAQSLRT